MKKQFCQYCGTRLDEGARFCRNCGEAVVGTVPGGNTSENYETESKRKIVYEGTLHKCPSCGEVLESFHTFCPTCGHELRSVRAASSIREFAEKLEAINAKQMPHFEEKKSVMKTLFGKDFKEKDETLEAVTRFEEQKIQEKASLIINFSVPNTKEDIMEFMLLACSNIHAKSGTSDEVTKAWISKLDQVYQKAELSMSGHPDFAQIKGLYDQKKKEIRKWRMLPLRISVGIFGCILLLGILQYHPFAVLIIGVLLIYEERDAISDMFHKNRRGE